MFNGRKVHAYYNIVDDNILVTQIMVDGTVETGLGFEDFAEWLEQDYCDEMRELL